MKKLFLLILLASVSVSAMAQKKEGADTHFVSDKIVKDTVYVTAPFVNIDGITYNRELLSKALQQSIVIQTDGYWNELYDYISGSKNGNYSVDQVNQLIMPFLSYVQRFKKQQQQDQQNNKVQAKPSK